MAAIGAGYALLVALMMRTREAAVLGIEHRDGVKFYVVPNSALRPVELVRTPGLRSDRLHAQAESKRPAEAGRLQSPGSRCCHGSRFADDIAPPEGVEPSLSQLRYRSRHPPAGASPLARQRQPTEI